MQLFIPGADTFFEVMPLNKGKKVKIYLSKREDDFNQDCKCFGNYYLEQIFNENNQIIKETIKENPHYIEDPYGPEDLEDYWEEVD